MSLAEQFEDAQRRVKALAKAPGNDTLLELYALSKQGTAGDATGSRPGMMDFKGRAQVDAWAGRKGMTKDHAMEGYVALVNRLTSA